MDGQKPKAWSRLKAWVIKNKSVLLFSTALVLVIGTASAILYVFYRSPEAIPLGGTVIKKPVPKYYSPLTGLEVSDEATTKRPLTAIMIENSPDARPQSGMKQAGVVYEAIAEAGITRFLCVYQEARPQLIGPVRSLRPYFLDWATPYDASIAHVGGSARALATVRNGQYKDIDQFFNGNYYWRSNDRAAPHNVYTSFDKLDALEQKKGYTTSTFQGFPRKKDEPSKTPNATKISVNMSSNLYNSSYTYDPKTNSYLRFEGGATHMDREEGQLSPKVVVVIKVPMSIGFEDGYREQIDTNGSGQAYVFQDGIVTAATWHKADQKTQMSFTDAANKPIKFNAGQTWISAIPKENNVTWQ